MFLHNRNTEMDFIHLIRTNRERFKGGVVHSFTGTIEEAREILELDLFIGINGCSLKTEENLKVVQSIPLSRILMETGKHH
jgi:TatD DNase family protein